MNKIIEINWSKITGAKKTLRLESENGSKYQIKEIVNDQTPTKAKLKLEVGAGVTLQYKILYQSSNSQSKIERNIYLAKDAKVDVREKYSGQCNIFNKNNIELQGRDAEYKCLTILNIDGNASIKNENTILHNHSFTESNLKTRGVLKDKAQVDIWMKSIVLPEAFKCHVAQSAKLWLLSDEAKAVVSPELDIENNDVICDHKVILSSVDQRDQFYLMSRGFTKKESEELLVKSILSE